MNVIYRVNFKAKKWISGGYCEEVLSEEEYSFYKDFSDELSALNFIEEEEYYETETNTSYLICEKDNPIKITK